MSEQLPLAVADLRTAALESAGRNRPVPTFFPKATLLVFLLAYEAFLSHRFDRW